MAVLLAIAGPVKGTVFHLAAEEVTIGRLASSTLCVGDPSVSRQHCVILTEQDGRRICDLGSNNGTFVNGKRVDECALADGDKIRIGDTVFQFGEKEGGVAEQPLAFSDNGLIANTCVQRPDSESAATVIRRLFESVPQGGDSAMRARSFLKIGAALNAWQEPEVLVVELLKQLLQVVPADQAAIVLLRRSGGGDPAITGWNRRSNSSSPVSVSRTLITSAITGSTAIFSDDVTSNEELSDASSLTRRRINSVIVVPLIPNGKTIGAVYLDSSDTVNQLTRNDLEFVALVAEYAGTTLEGAQKLIALKEENGRLQSALRLRHNLIGFSASMQRISDRIAKIARTDATVM